MRLGILGTGHIGKTLVTKLSAAGHEVKVANSRGPESIDRDLLSQGAQATTAKDALSGVDVVILSIPMERIKDISSLFHGLPKEVIVIDTSNLMPYRTGRIEAIEAGQPESQWVSDQLGHPVTKAWNSIYAGSFATMGKPYGTPDRIALPVASDREYDKRIAMALVEDTGFDAVDAGPLSESWRQQPGSPVYCTDLTREELIPLLAAAERHRLAKRRDLSMAVMDERVGDGMATIDREYVVRLLRAIFI